jgi:NADPH:quinone reductase-like Zn-dependent oxidoreductase
LVLVRAAGLKEGDRVLVNGASGGVGSFVVQMCKALVGETGRVVGVCSGGSAEAVKGLGADEVGWIEDANLRS